MFAVQNSVVNDKKEMQPELHTSMAQALHKSRVTRSWCCFWTTGRMAATKRWHTSSQTINNRTIHENTVATVASAKKVKTSYWGAESACNNTTQAPSLLPYQVINFSIYIRSNAEHLKCPYCISDRTRSFHRKLVVQTKAPKNYGSYLMCEKAQLHATHKQHGRPRNF